MRFTGELFSYFTGFAEERALMVKSCSIEQRDLLLGQLRAASSALQSILLLAGGFLITLTTLLLLFDSPALVQWVTPIVVVFYAYSYKLHVKLLAYSAESDTSGELLLSIRNRLVAIVVIVALSWVTAFIDLWASQLDNSSMIASSLTFGIISCGSMLFIRMPYALNGWAFPTTVGGALAPLLVGVDLPWYYYASVVMVGFTQNRIAMLQWRAFIETIEEATAFANDRATFYTQEQERILALETERENASSARTEERKLADAERTALMSELAGEFEQSVHGTIGFISNAVGTVGASVEQLAEISAQSRTRAETMAAMANSMSEAIQMVATAAQQLGDSSHEISKQVGDQLSATTLATGSSRAGSQTMSELIREAKKISGIAEIIQVVASKTSLLALNASIEAARAGEAGRGFAVVAGEVKALAGQTNSAIGTVTQTIAAIQQQMAGAAETVGATVGELDRVQKGAGNIAAAISQQAAATREIGNNADFAARNADDVRAQSAEVNEEAARIGEVADEMNQIMRELEGRASHLKDASTSFLLQLRAA